MDCFAKRNFSIEQIPDLTGKIAIVTGSSTGVSEYISFISEYSFQVIV